MDKLLNLYIPIRWRWSVLVGLAVTAAIVVLYVMVLDIEHDAWLNNQAAQAELQVDRLTDALKLPLLSGSHAETDLGVHGFLETVPTVLGVLIQYPDGQLQRYGRAPYDASLIAALADHQQVEKLPVKALWYARTVAYADTPVAVVAVRFSERAWERIANKLGQKIFMAAVVVVLLSGLLVFWIAGRMSKPIELLGHAARRVADGDYQLHLPVTGHDELSDTLNQFNVMAQELAHKATLRDVVGRYLNPELVKDVFDVGGAPMQNHRQEVTVLFADMVGFSSFSEASDSQLVVDLLNRHFEIFHRIITHYGGYVDKYIGDAVMAVFNHPVHDDQHVCHAAKAGLAMALACARAGLMRSDGEAIAFRFGMNCGQAIVGNIGAARRLEYTVMGDAVNVASRMGALGDGGDVMMNRQSYDALGNAGFAFHAIDVCQVKGVSQPMQIGRVTAEAAIQQELEQVVAMALAVK